MKTTLAILLALTMAPAVAHADETADAKEHFVRGTKLFDLTRYRDAAREYQSAYELKDEPALLFNIAQAYRLAGDYDEAIKFYKSFMRRVPRTRNRREVEARIVEMTALVAEHRRQQLAPPDGTLQPGTTEAASAGDAAAQKNPAPVVAAVPEAVVDAAPQQKPAPLFIDANDAKRGRVKLFAGVGVGAVGIAAAAAGIACGVFSLKTSSSVQNGTRYDDTLAARGRALGYSADGLLALGGAALVSGTILIIVGKRQSGRERVALSPTVAPGKVAVSATVRF